jgi:glutamate synthase (NADPH/NADH) small chain
MERQRVRALPKLLPGERIKGFAEIFGTVKPQFAVAEASRCTLCNEAPCIEACPARVDIPQFIRMIRSRSFRAAARVIRGSNPLVAICGRVCPQNELCEGACRTTGIKEPVAIGALQRFVGDMDLEKIANENEPATQKAEGRRAAIVGAGPASISCAVSLRSMGVEVEIFEQGNELGGLLASGIPRFRLPEDIRSREIGGLLGSGVRVRTNEKVGDIEKLYLMGFDAVFLGIGLGESKSAGIRGEKLQGVSDWREFLNPDFQKQTALKGRTLIIGGGNAAVDCACSALRMGSDKVTVLYRRSEHEMPAWEKERELSKEEGIEFRFHVAPLEFIGDFDGRVTGLRCIQTRAGELEEDGRRTPVPVADTEHDVPAETVVVALGQKLSGEFLRDNPRLEVDSEGRIVVDKDTCVTSIRGVFAGGDAVNGGGTVVQAVADGKRAAKGIIEFLRK